MTGLTLIPVLLFAQYDKDSEHVISSASDSDIQVFRVQLTPETTILLRHPLRQSDSKFQQETVDLVGFFHLISDERFSDPV